MSEEEEILARIKAADELHEQGYTKENCTSCRGTGYALHFDIYGYPDRQSCMGCGGKGYHWKGPLLR